MMDNEVRDKKKAEEHTERNQAVNQLKMLSVTAIFLIHCKFPGRAGEIIRGVASFGVPVFFMIAGFYSYRISRSKIRKRAGHLFQLIIGANLFYLVWDLAYLCLTGENVAVWTAENLNWKKLLIFLLFNETPLRGHLWFLGALWYCYLLLLLFAVVLSGRNQQGKEWYSRAGKAVTAVLLLGNLVLGEALTGLGHNLQIPYVRNWLFCGVPCFLAGYLIRERQENQTACKMTRKMMIVLIVFCAVFGAVETCLIPDSELYLGTLLLALFSFMYVAYRDGKKTGCASWYLEFVDRNASLIYILQVAVIKTLQLILQRTGLGDNKVMAWIMPFAAFALTCLTAELVTKIRVCILHRK